MKSSTKKIIMCIGCLSALFMLCSCQKKDTVLLKETELIGTWADESDPALTVSFYEDKSYSFSAPILPNGTFQIGKDKKVKLVDPYNTVYTLSPEMSDGFVILSYSDQNGLEIQLTKFSDEPVDAPSISQDSGHIDASTFAYETVIELLTTTDWYWQTGMSLKFLSSSECSTQGDSVLTYRITDVKQSADGYSFTMCLTSEEENAPVSEFLCSVVFEEEVDAFFLTIQYADSGIYASGISVPPVEPDMGQ